MVCHLYSPIIMTDSKITLKELIKKPTLGCGFFCFIYFLLFPVRLIMAMGCMWDDPAYVLEIKHLVIHIMKWVFFINLICGMFKEIITPWHFILGRLDYSLMVSTQCISHHKPHLSSSKCYCWPTFLYSYFLSQVDRFISCIPISPSIHATWSLFAW